jgi:DNA-binding PadR family transcriptional regulator
MPPRLLTLSGKEQLILELLIRHGACYGLQLVAESRGQLRRGTVYVTLGRMEEKGYISAHIDAAAPAHGGLPRPRYAPTALGRRVLAAWTSGASRLMPEFAR